MPSLHKGKGMTNSTIEWWCYVYGLDGEGRPKGQHGTMSDGELWLYHLMNFAQVGQ